MYVIVLIQHLPSSTLFSYTTLFRSCLLGQGFTELRGRIVVVVALEINSDVEVALRKPVLIEFCFKLFMFRDDADPTPLINRVDGTWSVWLSHTAIEQLEFEILDTRPLQ